MTIRKKITDIIQEMLSETEFNGDGPTTEAVDQLEKLVVDERIIGIGWMYADACVTADAGENIREKNLADILERAVRDFHY